MALINLEVQAQVNDAIRAMGRMNAQFDIMGKVNQDAAGALGVFGVSLTALNNPLTLVAEGMKASIDKSIEWGNTIDDVQKITGQSAEETSKLVTVMGDFGIEAGTLKGAAKALKEQGLTPNLETLKSLAKQYQSIQDPAKRVEWGTKTLGRSFFDLSEILTKTPEEFAAVEQAALTSGKVIGQDFVDDIEAAQIKAKQLQDRVDGLMLKLGPVLIDTVSGAADSFSMLGTIWATANVKGQQLYGIIDEQQAQLRLEAIAAGDTAAVFQEQMVPALEDVKRGNDDLVVTTKNYGTALDKTKDDALALIEVERRSKMVAGELKDAQDLLNAVIGGAVGNELEAYRVKQSDVRIEMENVKEELDKLTAQQGKTYTTTKEATTTQAEYELALQKSAEAAQKLTDNTDPEKVLSLKVAAEQAAEKAEKMALGLGGVSVGIIDNKTKIDELKTKYAELDETYKANITAHEEATARIVFGYLQQQYAADGLSFQEIKALTSIGEAWGIYDKKTADTLRSVTDSVAKHGTDSEAILNDLKTAVTDLPDYKDFVYNVTAPNLRDIQNEINNLPGGSSGRHGGATGDGYASGTNGWMTVPAGYPNDSYPIRLSSGENFAVTPQGKAGPVGGLYIGNVSITAAPGQDAEALWKQIRVIAARDARAMSQAGIRA